MRMAALRLEQGDYDVVLGPCPGCLNWQLDYTNAVAGALGLDRFHEAVEQILQDHLAECPHLRLLLRDS